MTLSFRLQAFHLLWLSLPAPSANFASLNARPTTPVASLLPVWALPGSLAATTGIIVLFSFPSGTKMFQFPEFAHMELCIHSTVLLTERVAPFGYPRVKAYLAAHRGLSQPVTSFFASRYLGIHRVPLICFRKFSLKLVFYVSYEIVKNRFFCKRRREKKQNVGSTRFN